MLVIKKKQGEVSFGKLLLKKKTVLLQKNIIMNKGAFFFDNVFFSSRNFYFSMKLGRDQANKNIKVQSDLYS